MIGKLTVVALAAFALQAVASPLPQATVTALIPPPGLPTGSYVAVGTGSAGDVTVIAQRVATVNGSATTVYDAADLGPSQVAFVEAGGDGKIMQGVVCQASSNGTVNCLGAVNGQNTTYAYVLRASASPTVVTALGLTALPTAIITALPALASGAAAFSAAVASVPPVSTVSVLPGFVGQNVTISNSTMMANSTISASASRSMTSA
ncbi:hypothetical protein EMMF5_000714 [Cystobasidiomycetes sp. EMM_F5]